MLLVGAVGGDGVARDVAILTDPGGPVLPLHDKVRGCALPKLRSSPTLEGRCCNLHQSPEGELRILVAILTDPGGPVLRSWPRLPHSPTAVVAILTDPGGPVLHDHLELLGALTRVAILTDPGGPVLP